jgi:hypothetical protein
MRTKTIVVDDTEPELIRVCGLACIAKEQLSHFTYDLSNASLKKSVL